MAIGRIKIDIPLTKDELNESTITDYLPYIIEKHVKNIEVAARLNDYRCGVQPILLKTKSDDMKSNVKIVENHAYSIVNFKQGYMYGNEVKYSLRSGKDNNEELLKINEVFVEKDKSSLDSDIALDVYTFGAGYRMALPIEDEDKMFEIYNLDYNSTFMVYSSTYTSEKLFGGTITKKGFKDPYYEVVIYAEDFTYRFVSIGNASGKKFKASEKIPFNYMFQDKLVNQIGMIPIIEYTIGKDRVGAIEVVETILDAINTLSSNAVDNIVDYVNSVFFVKNMIIDRDVVSNILENRTINLNTTDPNRPADAGYISNPTNNSDTDVKYQTMLAVAYELVGVPRILAQFSSGGDTGQARAIGGGWTRAEVVATHEEKSLKKAEKEFLNLVLRICKSKSSVFGNLSVSDIEINFTRNMSDNLLVKTQSLTNLISVNMPLEHALNMCLLTANPHEVASDWQAKIEEERLYDEQQLQLQTSIKNSEEKTGKKEQVNKVEKE